MDAVVKIVEPKKFIEGKVYCEGLTLPLQEIH